MGEITDTHQDWLLHIQGSPDSLEIPYVEGDLCAQARLAEISFTQASNWQLGYSRCFCIAILMIAHHNLCWSLLMGLSMPKTSDESNLEMHAENTANFIFATGCESVATFHVPGGGGTCKPACQLCIQYLPQVFPLSFQFCRYTEVKKILKWRQQVKEESTKARL